jgi:spore maturation protein SpmB
METIMHGSFDKSDKADNDHGHPNWSIGFFALPALVVILLVGLTMINPGASNWISDAVQAEFVGFNSPPEAAPVQLAQPAGEIRTVKAE